jgi:hypothetical protein
MPLDVAKYFNRFTELGIGRVANAVSVVFQELSQALSEIKVVRIKFDCLAVEAKDAL